LTLYGYFSDISFSELGDGPRSAGVERSKTTINVMPANREGRPVSPKDAAGATNISRSNTQITPGRPSPNASIGGPVRGLSVRRPGASPNNPAPAPPSGPKGGPNSRLTEFYDDYLDSYGDDNNSPPVPNIQAAPTDRVGAWARSNANPNYPPLSRNQSRSAPNSQYAPSSYGGPIGSIRRKPTRRNTRATSRIQSTYEEEEGYVSGEYDDGPYELTLIRVKVCFFSGFVYLYIDMLYQKLHYKDDIRGMTLSPELAFMEFMEKVTAKFDKDPKGLSLKFKDEDGIQVSLRDESDYELAIETAREHAKGKSEGKLEIWCADT